MPLSDPTSSIAYASLNTGSADVPSAAPLPHTHPAPPSANPPSPSIDNGQLTIDASIPHSPDLSSPAGMDLIRLAAHYAETDLVASFESRRSLPPSDPSFSVLLHRDTRTLWTVTAVRKTIITLDRYLEDYAEYLAQKAAAQAQAEAAQIQSEAEQARLEAEAEARAELRRQGIDRAEALLTQLAVEDPAFQAALDKAGADLAAEFARLRDPEIVSPVQAQKRIDDEARQVAYKILSTLYNAHPYSGLQPSSHADAADRLARAERGEPLPDPAPDEDDDDDWDADDWDDADDDDDDDDEDALSPGARASSPAPAADDSPLIGINQDASSLGARTPSSATATACQPAPLSLFNPQAAIRHWQSEPYTPATRNTPQSPSNTPQSTNNEQQTTNNEPCSIRNPQSAIRNCAVPVCPTLSPRRLEAVLSKVELNGARPESTPAPTPESAPISSLPDSDSGAAQSTSVIIPESVTAPDVPNYPVSIIHAASPRRIPVSAPCAKGPPHGF